jgi:hypothetical protein
MTNGKHTVGFVKKGAESARQQHMKTVGESILISTYLSLAADINLSSDPMDSFLAGAGASVS